MTGAVVNAEIDERAMTKTIEDDESDAEVDFINAQEAEIGTDMLGATTEAQSETQQQDEIPPKTVAETYESRFAGKFPDIPVAQSIDYQGLLQDDKDPFFVTLPIAKIGAVSQNGLVYTDDMVRSIAEQINQRRIVGMRGHIPDDERSTAYPEPAVYWIGAQIVEGTLYAKGYIPPGATRDEFRIRKRLNMDVATSIYGRARNIKEREDGTYTAEIELEQIDLAPPERAALQMKRGFTITKEIENTQGENSKTGEQMMSMDEIKAALDAMSDEELAALLGDRLDKLMQMRAPKVEENTAQTPVAPEVTAEAVAEMKRESASKDATIAELRARVAEYERTMFNSAVDSKIAEATNWNVSEDADIEALKALRATLKTAVLAEMGDNRALNRVDEAVVRVMENNRALVAALRDRLSGPGAFIAMGESQKRIASREEGRSALERLGWS